LFFDFVTIAFPGVMYRVQVTIVHNVRVYEPLRLPADRQVAKALCGLGSSRQPNELTLANHGQQWLIHAVRLRILYFAFLYPDNTVVHFRKFYE